MLCIALGVSSTQLACSLVQSPEAPSDTRAHVEHLVQQGKHSDAARGYAQLAQALPADHDYYELQSADQWIAGGDLPEARHALDAVSLAPGERASVGTGIAVQIPVGQAGLVLPRSGLSARHGVSVVNAPGLIDAGYRGELRVLLLNTDRLERVELPAGARIAQLVLVRVELATPVEVAALEPSARGVGGFGSTGH